MAHKSINISILRFDEHSITRLRARTGDKGHEVMSYDHDEAPDSSKSLEERLKSFATRHQLAEDRLITVLPRHEVTARFLDLPSHDLAELRDMVHLSAEEYVPYPVDELIIDLCVLERESNGNARVLAAFAHRDVVEKHLKTLEAAGLEPDSIYLSTPCLAVATLEAHKGTSGCSAVVDLELNGIEVIVLKDGHLVYGRAVSTNHDWRTIAPDALLPQTHDDDPAVAPITFDDAPPVDDACEELRHEVRSSLASYRRDSEDGMGIENLYASSDVLEVTHLCGVLQEAALVECSPAKLGVKLFARGGQMLEYPTLTLIGAYLTADSDNPLTINLLPRALAEKRKLQSLRKTVLRIVAVILVNVVAFGGLYFQAAYQRQSYIAELQKRIKAIEPQARGVIEKQKQLRILREQVDRSGSVLELLASLSDLAPSSDLNIASFQFRRNEGVQLSGRTSSQADSANFAQAIREMGKNSLPLFAGAKHQYTQETAERDVKVWDYALEIPFPVAEEKSKEDTSRE